MSNDNFWEGYVPEPTQPRAWFTVDELNAWAEKKLKENPHWAEQPAPVREDWGPGPHEVHSLPAPQPAQRKPLTDEVIFWEYQRIWPFHPAEEPTLAKAIVKFARAIEAAHGIKENT